MAARLVSLCSTRTSLQVVYERGSCPGSLPSLISQHHYLLCLFKFLLPISIMTCADSPRVDASQRVLSRKSTSSAEKKAPGASSLNTLPLQTLPAQNAVTGFFTNAIALQGHGASLLHKNVLAAFAPQLAINPQPSHKLFSIRACKNSAKGLGMFSKTQMPMGRLIDVEVPFIITPTELAPLDLPASEIYHSFFSSLSPKVLSKLKELSNAYASKCKNDTDAYEGIMKTNALDVDLPASDQTLVPHKALFLHTSRCNHRFVFVHFSDSRCICLHQFPP
jgi:hypothetical protein